MFFNTWKLIKIIIVDLSTLKFKINTKMKKYIAFLRGINVGGNKKIKMITLRASIEKAGFKKVQSYIQSGNILFNCNQESVLSISKKIEAVILKDFRLEVPVLVTTKESIMSILKDYPFTNSEEKNQYFVLLHNSPDKALVENFNTLKFETEDYYLTENCVYLDCKQGAGKAKLNNNLVEKKLKVTATTRNLKTMQKIVELAG